MRFVIGAFILTIARAISCMTSCFFVFNRCERGKRMGDPRSPCSASRPCVCSKGGAMRRSRRSGSPWPSGATDAKEEHLRATTMTTMTTTRMMTTRRMSFWASTRSPSSLGSSAPSYFWSSTRRRTRRLTFWKSFWKRGMTSRTCGISWRSRTTGAASSTALWNSWYVSFVFMYGQLE